MKVEKLPSGSYRVRKRIDGKDVAVVLSYKPTQKEADRLLREKASGKDKLRLTFKEASDKYIDGKKPTLSPSTIRGYKSIQRNLPEWFLASQLGDLTSWDIQRVVSELAKRNKPKTVSNYYAFISAILATFMPHLNISITMPKKPQNEPYLPSDSDVKAILNHYAGTEYEVAFRLACYGLRRSEICAITSADLDGNTLTVNKAKVSDGSEWVIKQPKTPESVRRIKIDNGLASLLKAQNAAFTGNPNMLYNKLRQAQKLLDLPEFPLHALRHYYASTMHRMGFSNAAIMKNGGWKTDHVMKRTYIQAVQDEADEAQEQFIAMMRDKI